VGCLPPASSRPAIGSKPSSNQLILRLARENTRGATAASRANCSDSVTAAPTGHTAAAGAILDRFLHHAEIIQLAGARSYRMHERQRRRVATDADLGPASDAERHAAPAAGHPAGSGKAGRP
jgi:hypothetical protein